MRSKTMSAACALGVLASPAAVALVAPETARSASAGQAATLPVAPEGATATLLQLTDLREAGVRLALDRHLTVVRRHARAAGLRTSRAERSVLRRRMDDLPPERIAERTTSVRRDLRRLHKRLEKRREATVAVPGHLQAIASCESGGDPGAVDPSGTYRGKYQFDLQTWASVGGSGDPAAAPESEQDKRAAMLYAQSGATPWPVCGQ